jgi:hypothetical protein
MYKIFTKSYISGILYRSVGSGDSDRSQSIFGRGVVSGWHSIGLDLRRVGSRRVGSR